MIPYRYRKCITIKGSHICTLISYQFQCCIFSYGLNFTIYLNGIDWKIWYDTKSTSYIYFFKLLKYLFIFKKFNYKKKKFGLFVFTKFHATFGISKLQLFFFYKQSVSADVVSLRWHTLHTVWSGPFIILKLLSYII